MSGTPYVVRQGDHLSRLAAERGLDPDEVWSHPENAKLRRQRSSMDILCAGDVLFLPPPRRTWLSVDVGATNRFVATVPTVSVNVTLHFGEAALASAKFRVRELPNLGELETDGAGNAKFRAPAALASATLEFADPPLCVVLHIGHLDPIDTQSGLRQRLMNLGYLNSASAEPSDLRSAVATFQLGREGVEANGLVSKALLQALADEHGS